MKDYKTPRGTQDILPDSSASWMLVEQIMHSMAASYGYQKIVTPIFEDTAVFKRENDSSDMVTKEMYTFSINNEDSLTLRPEGTAGAIRAYVQHKLYALPDQPVKLFYCGPMFRYERPQKGRYRQFNQFGIECIGAKSPLLDVEAIALGYSIVKAVGLKDIVVKVNSLGNKASRDDYRNKLINYFEPLKDQLCEDCQRRLLVNPLRVLDCKVDATNPIMENVPHLSDSLDEESKNYFQQVLDSLDSLGIPYEIDEKLVRGLDYYTDTVFEVQSTNPASGSQSTVFGGGRYDGLVEYFGGPEVSGIGFAIGIERLLLLAQDEGLKLTDNEKNVEVYVMSIGDTQAKALEICQQARALGFISEFNCLPRGLKAQFKTVDRLKAKVIIIVAEDELKENKVNVKNIETQLQETVPIDELNDYLLDILGE